MSNNIPNFLSDLVAKQQQVDDTVEAQLDFYRHVIQQAEHAVALLQTQADSPEEQLAVLKNKTARVIRHVAFMHELVTKDDPSSTKAFVGEFKKRSAEYAKGELTAEHFVAYLESFWTGDISVFLDDLTELLPEQGGLKQQLVDAHRRSVRHGPWKSTIEPHLDLIQSLRQCQEQSVPLPVPPQVSIELNQAQHLVFVIHGIGEHADFGATNDCADMQDGGYFQFKRSFADLLGMGGMFQDLPMNLHFESIEWHETLRESCELEHILKLDTPPGVSSIRAFLTDTFIDALLYLSSTYGQLIIDSVCAQLNKKYEEYIEQHPGFSGPVSIVAHSLGSLIMFDILRNQRASRPSVANHSGIQFPQLQFGVRTLFIMGSPVAYLHLSRGYMFDSEGKYQPETLFPNGTRVVNIVHPFDPIAWKVGEVSRMTQNSPENLRGDDSATDEQPPPATTPSPQDQHTTPSNEDPPTQLDASATVLLPTVESLAKKSLSEILHMFAKEFAKLQCAGEDDLQVTDCLIPTKRHQRAVEMAYVTSAHSCYWTQPEVAICIVVTLCEPLYTVINQYLDLEHPPLITKVLQPLALERPATFAGKLMVKNPITDVWTEKWGCIQDGVLQLLEMSPEEAVGGFMGCIDLERCCCLPIREMEGHQQSEDEDLVFGFQIIPLVASGKHSEVFEQGVEVARSQESYHFRIETPSRAAQTWMTAVKALCSGDPKNAKESQRDLDSIRHRFGETSVCRLFPSEISGFVQRKTSSSSLWGESWKDYWLNLTAGSSRDGIPPCLTWYKKKPSLDSTLQFDFSARKHRLEVREGSLLFRMIGPNGSVFMARVENTAFFRQWTQVLSLYAKHPAQRWKLSSYESSLNEDDSLVTNKHNTLHQDDPRSIARLAKLSIHVEGYKVCLDQAMQQYVRFVIHASSGKHSLVVLRRYSEFSKLHIALASEVAVLETQGEKTEEDDDIDKKQLPELPGTRYFNRFEDGYLLKKGAALQLYLRELHAIEAVRDSETWESFLCNT